MTEDRGTRDSRITTQPHTLLHIVPHGWFNRDDGETIVYLLDKAGDIAPVTTTHLLERLLYTPAAFDRCFAAASRWAIGVVRPLPDEIHQERFIRDPETIMPPYSGHGRDLVRDMTGGIVHV